MPHRGNAGLGEGFHLGQNGRPALDLDTLRSPFLQQTGGVVHGPFHGRLVGHEREVGKQEGALDTSPHRPGVVQHVFHGNLLRAGVSEDVRAQGISDENEVDSRLVLEHGGGIIVGGQGTDLVPFFFLGVEVGDSDFGGGRIGGHWATQVKTKSLVCVYSIDWPAVTGKYPNPSGKVRDRAGSEATIPQDTDLSAEASRGWSQGGRQD